MLARSVLDISSFSFPPRLCLPKEASCSLIQALLVSCLLPWDCGCATMSATPATVTFVSAVPDVLHPLSLLNPAVGVVARGRLLRCCLAFALLTLVLFSLPLPVPMISVLFVGLFCVVWSRGSQYVALASLKFTT